jgi:hypothetical protein
LDSGGPAQVVEQSVSPSRRNRRLVRVSAPPDRFSFLGMSDERVKGATVVRDRSRLTEELMEVIAPLEADEERRAIDAALSRFKGRRMRATGRSCASRSVGDNGRTGPSPFSSRTSIRIYPSRWLSTQTERSSTLSSGPSSSRPSPRRKSVTPWHTRAASRRWASWPSAGRFGRWRSTTRRA